jgi:hypothetical protein
MKPIKSLLLVGILAALSTLAPGEAAAQGRGGGYYASPPPSSVLPGGFHNRQGRLTFGFSGAIGGMSDDFGDIECDNCQAIGFGLAGHIGGFIGPRLALMLELQMNGHQLSEEAFIEDDQFLYQTAAMVALQYWVTPQLWLKGGIGFASVDIDDDAYYEETHIDSGMALMGGVGFELLSAQRFSVDLQGRLLAGSYDGIGQQITSATVGVGINWF